MMIFNKLTALLLLTSFSSCSFVAKKLNLPSTSEAIGLKAPNKGELYCKEKTNPQVIGNNLQNNSHIENFLEAIQDEYSFSFIEKAVVVHLLQMLARPDLTTPQSKLDFYYQRGSKTYFKTFSSLQDGNSFIRGLEEILKDFKTKRSLKDLIQIVDRRFGTDFLVDEDFAKFLKDNKTWIAQNSFSQKLYLRAEETLRKGETLPKQKLLPLYNKNFTLPKKKTDAKSYLYSFYDKNKNEFRCNYDMNQYGQSLFFISDYFIRGNVFGMHEKNEFFLATTTQRQHKKPLDHSIFFQGSSQVRSLALCIGNNMGLVSNDSRDPGQHLYHLIEYDVGQVRSNEELSSMISFSRHLFLTNPLRLIYESQRGSKEQLSELLELNVPLYNADSLGRVWGWFKPKNSNFSFHLDNRRIGSLSCQK